jgi:hypothetical protein
MDPLYRGAIATAISAASSVLVGLPVIDADHFSPATLHGVERLAGVIAWTVLVLEARYFKAWADKILGNGKGNSTGGAGGGGGAGGPMAAVILFMVVPFLFGCPKPEVTARDAIAAAHGYVTYGQAEWKSECVGIPASTKCVLVNRLIDGEHATADILAIYCAGIPKTGVPSYSQGGGCVEVKGVLPLLQASLANIQDLIKQINMFIPAGVKVKPVAATGGMHP